MIAYITELNNENYQSIIESGEVVLVDIWAPWCKSCLNLSPIIDELSADYQGQVVFGKLDADQSKEIAGPLGIRSIPTILIYKNGEIVERNSGLIQKQKLAELINKHI